jgi:hypothetical protein
MKIKFLAPAIIAAVAFCIFPSCKKETITTVIKTDTVLVPYLDRSVMGLLTNKQWKPDTVYYNYPTAPTLAYVRGGSGNTINLDGSRVMFWKDGSEDVYGYGSAYASLSWTFNGADSSVLFYPGTSTYQRILKLDAAHLNTYDSTNHTYNVLTAKP